MYQMYTLLPAVVYEGSHDKEHSIGVCTARQSRSEHQIQHITLSNVPITELSYTKYSIVIYSSK